MGSNVFVYLPVSEETNGDGIYLTSFSFFPLSEKKSRFLDASFSLLVKMNNYNVFFISFVVISPETPSSINTC